MAFKSGSQIRPELSRVDYSPVMQGAQAQAQAFQNIGNSLAMGINAAVEEKKIKKAELDKLNAAAVDASKRFNIPLEDAKTGVKAYGAETYINLVQRDQEQQGIGRALQRLQSAIPSHTDSSGETNMTKLLAGLGDDAQYAVQILGNLVKAGIVTPAITELERKGAELEIATGETKLDMLEFQRGNMDEERKLEIGERESRMESWAAERDLTQARADEIRQTMAAADNAEGDWTKLPWGRLTADQKNALAMHSTLGTPIDEALKQVMGLTDPDITTKLKLFDSIKIAGRDFHQIVALLSMDKTKFDKEDGVISFRGSDGRSQKIKLSPAEMTILEDKRDQYNKILSELAATDIGAIPTVNEVGGTPSVIGDVQ